MIADTLVDRYYYIFDSREHRTLVMDRATGSEFDWEDDVRAPLLRHVADAASEASEAMLRRFACWCARQTGAADADADTPTGRLWAVACVESGPGRAASSDDGSGDDGSGASPDGLGVAASVRQATLDDAVVASAVGVPRADPDAARLLATHACTHPDALRAAFDAAHMSERWAEFCATPSPAPVDASAPSDAPSDAAHAMRQRQIDWLLDQDVF